MSSFQTLRACTSLSSTNITNGYIEVALVFPLEFTNRLAYSPAYSAWMERGGAAIVDTFVQSGYRDITVCGFTVVLSLLPGAEAGDEVFVNAMAYGTTTTTACTI